MQSSNFLFLFLSSSLFPWHITQIGFKSALRIFYLFWFNSLGSKTFEDIFTGFGELLVGFGQTWFKSAGVHLMELPEFPAFLVAPDHTVLSTLLQEVLIGARLQLFNSHFNPFTILEFAEVANKTLRVRLLELLV